MGRAMSWLKGFFSGGGGNGKVTGARGGSRGENGGKRWGLPKAFGENKHRREAAAAAAVSGAKTPERTSLVGVAKWAEDVGETPRPSTSMVTAAPTSNGAAPPPPQAAVVNDGSAVRCKVRQVAAMAAVNAEPAATKSSPTAAVAGYGGRQEIEWAAAVAIQSAFRRHLARKALKALRGLVKIQALLRGHITRKKITEEYRCRLALVRVQYMALMSSSNSQELGSLRGNNHSGPHTPEKHELPASVFKRNSSRAYDSMPIHIHPSMSLPQNFAFADRSTTHVCWDGPEAVRARPSAAASDHHNHIEKILSVDSSERQHPIDRRLSSCSDARSRRHQQLHPSPSKDSNASRNSIPSVSPSADSRQSLSPSSFLNKPHAPSESATDSVRSSGSYYSTPHQGSGFARRGPLPFSPARSRSCASQRSGGSDLPSQLCPSYMAYTESSKAKARRYQSVPKQRSDTVEKPVVTSLKRLSEPGLGCADACRCHHLPPSTSPESAPVPRRFPLGKPYPGSGRLDRFGMPIGI